MSNSLPTAGLSSLAPPVAPWLRRAWHKAETAIWTSWKFARCGHPRVALDFGIGFGDDLLCTTVARELRARGQTGLWMLSDHPDIFAHNRDFQTIQPRSDDSHFLLARAAARIVRPFYCARDFVEDYDTSPKRHIITEMCAAAGLEGRIALRPYLPLTAAERQFGHFSDRQIAIQSSGSSAVHPMGNKEWLPERFAEVVEQLRGEFEFVQIGSASDPLLPGVRDLRGRTKLRETAALLANSRLFVGLVGFLMHLARAVDSRGVIVYGGREAPWQSGYICNENVATPDLPCSPCWRWNRCDFQRACMTQITAQDVIDAIRRQAARPVRTLEVEYATLPSAAPSSVSVP